MFHANRHTVLNREFLFSFDFALKLSRDVRRIEGFYTIK
jgi:hypothetical protein